MTDHAFSITVVDVGGFRQLCLRGELTTATTGTFDRAIRDVFEGESASIAIDLRLVQRVDGEGLQRLCDAAQSLRDESRHVTVIGPMRGQAQRVTELSGALQLLQPPTTTRRCVSGRMAS